MASAKKFKCPYCEKRFTRDNMIGHMERMHLDILPEEFTPLRMTFHVVNKRDIKYRRPCRVCGAGTAWDEKKGRYNFLCGNPACHDKWLKIMEDNMHGEMGKHRPTATPEGLLKMLNNRKISGKYRWSDGTIKTYTGSYEKKALMFFDQVLECRSEDVQSPGPIMEYDIDGRKRLYIPDIYYAPFNLIIEIKDGGTNPNTNPNYGETLKRKMAKEKHVINNTTYNYLRLTDNNFGQLLSTFMELKMNLSDDNEISKRVVRVNENMAAMGVAPMVGMNSVVIVNYMQNNVFSDDDPNIAVADSPKFDTIFARNKEGILKKTDKSMLEESDYEVYIIQDKKDKIMPEFDDKVDDFVDEQFIYETIFGHKRYTADQIKYEAGVKEIPDYYNELNNISNHIKQEIGIGGEF